MNLARDRVVWSEEGNRSALLETFQELLLSEVEWDRIFGQKLLDPEEVSCWLVAYSRGLHSAGNAYNKYPETTNAVAMARPI